MFEKTFYLPEYQLFVYCHLTRGDVLILGSLCRYYEDAKQNILRQSMTIDKFIELSPIEVSLDDLPHYDFVEPATYIKNSFRTKVSPHIDSNLCYIEGADVIEVILY